MHNEIHPPENTKSENAKLLLHVYLMGVVVSCFFLASSVYMNLIDKLSFHKVLGIAILWPLFSAKGLFIGIWWIFGEFVKILFEGGKILLRTW